MCKILQLFNSDHKTYFIHLSKLISDLEKFSILATGVYNTSTLAPDTATSIGCTSQSFLMANNSGDPNADKSMDTSEMDPPDGSPSLVKEAPVTESSSNPLIGDGLHTQFPKYWYSGGF